MAEPDALDEATEDPRDSERWLCVDAIESSDALRIMEDFPTSDDLRLGQALAQAIEQRKPFVPWKRKSP